MRRRSVAGEVQRQTVHRRLGYCCAFDTETPSARDLSLTLSSDKERALDGTDRQDG
jgi:hypothetical protein